MTLVADPPYTSTGVIANEIAPFVTDSITAAGSAAVDMTVIKAVGIALCHISTDDIAIVITYSVAFHHASAVHGAIFCLSAIYIAKVSISAAAVVTVTIIIPSSTSFCPENK